MNEELQVLIELQKIDGDLHFYQDLKIKRPLELEKERRRLEEAQSKVAGAQLDVAKLELEKGKMGQEGKKFDLELAKLRKELMVAEADIASKRAKAEKDLVDAEAQRIENAWVRRHGLGNNDGQSQ